ncbi:hypothetical protein WA026_005982 [Henosepilachna vigintioctopunctata]|uniref:Uncharacterized protein n=1 Tax=Henosepilachna vigintioctopunctata TaxID=420089 RepID=A0AAW1U2N9_9CUCU
MNIKYGLYQKNRSTFYLVDIPVTAGSHRPTVNICPLTRDPTGPLTIHNYVFPSAENQFSGRAEKPFVPLLFRRAAPDSGAPVAHLGLRDRAVGGTFDP